MGAQRTPGPWVQRLDSNEQINIYGGENEQSWIAMLPHQCVRAIEEEQKVNAKLIVAAPELADELEEALRWADESETDPCPVCGVTPAACGCWVGAARATLRKAGR
jgi:formate dehydrogenase maturation protein FdhE